MRLVKFLILGFIFGIILTKSEVISWFRIQEMFRFQAFHMYGIIGSAIVVGGISLQIIKRMQAKTINGESIKITSKPFTWGNVIGGTIFGLGWAMTGACPGPLYALIGNGLWVIGVSVIFALFGVWVYGFFQSKLPH